MKIYTSRLHCIKSKALLYELSEICLTQVESSNSYPIGLHDINSSFIKPKSGLNYWKRLAFFDILNRMIALCPISSSESDLSSFQLLRSGITFD